MNQNRPNQAPPAEPIILEAPGHPISRKKIDPDALSIIERLDRQGFLACLVGGAVRDLMLGKTPKDFDIATDARPGQIKKRFANSYVIGRRFRLVHVHFPGGKAIEVATFRKDPTPDPEGAEAPVDPAAIYGTPREDAFRRDITINALLYDAALNAVIDYVGGLEDLAKRRIRVIGDPCARFAEDPVRIWRVLRHAARLGFDIEPGAEAAVRQCAPLLAKSSGARLYEEFNKELAYETRPVIEALRRHGILRYILGRAGEVYEREDGRFSRLCGLLEIEDRARTAGVVISHEEMYALIFWPWVEPLLLREGRFDLHKALLDQFQDLQAGATIPKLVKANVIQMLDIAGTMIRALRTGHMRWSLQKRAHYAPADRLYFLIEKGRPPAPGESFEADFKQAFPMGTRPKRGGWRPPRKRYRGKPKSGA